MDVDKSLPALCGGDGDIWSPAAVSSSLAGTEPGGEMNYFIPWRAEEFVVHAGVACTAEIDDRGEVYAGI